MIFTFNFFKTYHFKDKQRSNKNQENYLFNIISMLIQRCLPAIQPDKNGRMPSMKKLSTPFEKMCTTFLCRGIHSFLIMPNFASWMQ